MPPMVSAIKKNGVPLYKLARQGKQVEREPRFVRVYAQEIEGNPPPGDRFPRCLQQGVLCPHLRE